jgi:hypothetical protein
VSFAKPNLQIYPLTPSNGCAPLSQIWAAAVQAVAGPVYPTYAFWGREMPRVHSDILDGAAFTFRTRQEAEKRLAMGGTCFLVVKPIKDHLDQPIAIPYLVTNRHVVFASGASVVSLNRLDGGAPDILEYEPTDWVPHPGGDDLAAIIPNIGELRIDRHKLRPVKTTELLTPDRIKQSDIGIGDDVVMVGRFVNHQGKRVNRTAIRFGNISMMTEDIWVQADRRYQESFAVEMRSRTGFSGSPVVVYRSGTVQQDGKAFTAVNFFGLLGVNWGYILDETGENTFLNGVVPAWKIFELLEAPALKDKHEELEKKIIADMKKGPSSGAVQAFASGASSPPATDANPTHREDFTNLLNAAAQKPAQED